MFDVRPFIRHPALAGVIGLAVAALFGTGAVFVWFGLRTMGDAPRLLTVREAALEALEARGGQVWVSISDGEWLDETLRQYAYSSDSDRRTEIVLTDRSRTAFVFAEFIGTLSFDDVSKRRPGGLLSQMSEKRYSTFVTSSELEPSEVPTREQMFCLWVEGSRRNSEFLLALFVFFAVLGLSLYPICLWAHRKWVVGQLTESAALTEAKRISTAPGRDLGQFPRVYRLNRSWLTVTVLAAILFLGCAALMVAGLFLQGTALGGDSLDGLDYFLGGVVLLFFLAFGVGGIAAAITSKVVVSREGITYHTMIGSLEADWGSFKVELSENWVESGASVTIWPSNPRASLRKWASFLPWNPQKGMVENGIPISRFGDANGLSLRRDIENCLATFGQQRESLAYVKTDDS